MLVDMYGGPQRTRLMSKRAVAYVRRNRNSRSTSGGKRGVYLLENFTPSQALVLDENGGLEALILFVVGRRRSRYGPVRTFVRPFPVMNSSGSTGPKALTPFGSRVLQ